MSSSFLSAAASSRRRFGASLPSRRPEYVPNRIDDPNYVRIFDATLHGTQQSPGATMTRAERVAVTRQLACLGVNVIAAGFPASSPDDFDTVCSVASDVGNTPVGDDGHVPVISGLSCCNKRQIDAAWEAVRHTRRPRIHMQHKLGKTPEQVVAIATEMVACARSLGCSDIEFIPKGVGRLNRNFLYHILEEVIRAGATTLNIQDTLPYGFGNLIADTKANTPGIENAIIFTHCLDDYGPASTNTLEGALAGAWQLGVTINGIGERPRNASLEEKVVDNTTNNTNVNKSKGLLSFIYTLVGTVFIFYSALSTFSVTYPGSTKALVGFDDTYTKSICFVNVLSWMFGSLSLLPFASHFKDSEPIAYGGLDTLMWAMYLWLLLLIIEYCTTLHVYLQISNWALWPCGIAGFCLIVLISVIYIEHQRPTLVSKWAKGLWERKAVCCLRLRSLPGWLIQALRSCANFPCVWGIYTIEETLPVRAV